MVTGETDTFTDWDLISSLIISYGYTRCLMSGRQHAHLFGTIISSSSHQKEKVIRFPKAQKKTQLLTWAFIQSHKSALEEAGTIDGHDFKLWITLWTIASSCVSTVLSRLKTSLLQGSVSPLGCAVPPWPLRGRCVSGLLDPQAHPGTAGKLFLNSNALLECRCSTTAVLKVLSGWH